MTDEVKTRTLTEMIMFKIDRSIAVLGIIVLGAWALNIATAESVQITMAAIGGLVGYVGGRTAN